MYFQLYLFIPYNIFSKFIYLPICKIKYDRLFLYIQSNSPSGSQLSALGLYLLVSLLFVFGTMVEFAGVLIVMQKLELDTNASKGNENRRRPETSFEEKESVCIHTISKVEPIDDVMQDSETRRGRGTLNRRSRVNHPGYFNALPRTTKIDFVAFFVFIFSYFIFNCIYFIYVRQVFA